MRWLVGVDLLESCHGAIRFAAWVHQHRSSEEIFGVHCLGAHELPPNQSEEDFHAWIEGLAEGTIAELGARSAFTKLVVLDADAAEHGLKQSLRQEAADVLVLGRKAKSDAHQLVRLGPVARRMIRSSPLPLAIVPPDLVELPPGPVVMATDLTASSQAALGFARAFAAMVGRDLLVAHAVAVEGSIPAFLSAKQWDETQRDATARGHAALKSYLAEQKIVARTAVISGAVVFGLLGLCERMHACVLVCGARRLSLVEALFSASVGSEFAALAAIPVMVVPPT